MFLDELLVAF